MTRSPILFRCDGNPSSGWETLYQCLVLAGALQRRRRGCHFLTRLEPLGLALAIHRAGNEWHKADEPIGTDEDLAQTLREARKLEAAAVVVAGDVSPDYLAELSAAGMLVAALDARAAIRFPADLVINPFLGPDLADYQFDRGTQLLLGPRYALVRPMIRRLRPLRAQEPPAPFRALVAVGDDDFPSDALERAEQLTAEPKLERIDIVVRSHHPRMDDLKALAEAHPERVEVVTEPADVNNRLSRCQVALTRGDAWSLELACLGVPQVVVTQGDRHIVNAQRLEEEGAATYLGDTAGVTATALRQALGQLLGSQPERQAMSRCARQLIDGRGPDRMVNALEILLHPARPAEQRMAA
jgi:spore coat polysaccharide biosynthesis predicted glycosyltransferase SpsG